MFSYIASTCFSTLDPYRALGVERNALDADIKKAYRDKALHWHPDRNPDNKEEAQKRFSEASQAYDVLKTPETRREYDLTGRVGGQAGNPGGPGQHGGFHRGPVSQADAERLFREAFGGHQGGDFNQILQQLLQQQMQQQAMQQGRFGNSGRPRVLQAGMEVIVRPDIATIHQASRASAIGTDNDERRAKCAGKVGTIVDTDPRDQSVKIRVMVMPGRADELWFGAGAVDFLPEQQDPQANARVHPFAGGMGMNPGRPGACNSGQPRPNGLSPGMEVQILHDVGQIAAASRACGIDAENDERRARCAGKVGTILEVDPRDQSLKVRVMVLPGRADEVWFGARAVELLPQHPNEDHFSQASEFARASG
jgi:molecular chaperone DnaJ